jgi:hypothetical protein
VKVDSGARRPARRAPGVSRIAAAALAGWLVAATTVASAADPHEKPKRRADHSTLEGSVAGESTFLDTPPFPGLDITNAFRIHLDAFTAPDASVGSGHVTVVRPEVGLRATWPVNDRLLVRIGARLAEARYRFRGNVWGIVPLPSGQAFDGDERIGDLNLHAARLPLEAAHHLSENTNWLAKGERWSVVGAAYIGSRWEDGDFDSGLDAGGGIGVGYEIPERLRVALGVSLHSQLDKADIDLDPLFSLRWRPVDRVTVRTRELGLQVELELYPAFEIFLAGFRSSDGYRLRDRAPLGDVFFRDRHVRVGGGIDWALANWLHFELEAGAVVERRLRVREEDLGTLLSERAGPSPYFEVRFDVRL